MGWREVKALGACAGNQPRDPDLAGVLDPDPARVVTRMRLALKIRIPVPQVEACRTAQVLDLFGSRI
jgi:hypothetical protein